MGKMGSSDPRDLARPSQAPLEALPPVPDQAADPLIVRVTAEP